MGLLGQGKNCRRSKTKSEQSRTSCDRGERHSREDVGEGASLEVPTSQPRQKSAGVQTIAQGEQDRTLSILILMEWFGTVGRGIILKAQDGSGDVDGCEKTTPWPRPLRRYIGP